MTEPSAVWVLTDHSGDGYAEVLGVFRSLDDAKAAAVGRAAPLAWQPEIDSPRSAASRRVLSEPNDDGDQYMIELWPVGQSVARRAMRDSLLAPYNSPAKLWRLEHRTVGDVARLRGQGLSFAEIARDWNLRPRAGEHDLTGAVYRLWVRHGSPGAPPEPDDYESRAAYRDACWRAIDAWLAGFADEATSVRQP